MHVLVMKELIIFFFEIILLSKEVVDGVEVEPKYIELELVVDLYACAHVFDWNMIVSIMT